MNTNPKEIKEQLRNLKEIMEQFRQAENRGKKQEPGISVTIKAEEVVELIHAVDMLMNSITRLIERMPPSEQMTMSMMLLDCIKGRMKDE